MGAQGVHLGGSLLVKGAEERKEEAVLVEPSRPSTCVDHALLQPSPHVGVLGLEIAEDQLVHLLPLVVVVHLLHLRRLRVRLAPLLQWLGRRWPRALRRCLLPAALLAVAAHATADATVYHQNLLLQFSRKLSWLGSCLAPPCRGLRPTPALCAPSRGCDEPVARHCLPRSADEVRAVRRG